MSTEDRPADGIHALHAMTTRPRMLIVDDQPTNIQVLYRLFTEDFQIFMATSGEQALAMAMTEQPDIILLDVVMPGLDGLEVCRRLQRNSETSEIAVLFVTAQQSPEEETEALAAGGVDFITKPINPAVVRARVRTHLTLKRQTDLFRQMAFVDGLTQSFNRRYFDDRLDGEFKRCARNKHPLGLIMCDVDFFKRYNDSMGHQAGDECLQRVSQAMKRALLRPGDVFARYGGEEFACILPDTTLEGAFQVAQRIASEVEAAAIAHPTSGVSSIVTLSLGVAVKMPDSQVAMVDLIALADAKLYEAKGAGRARACGAIL
jgi:diguanylate cyclase (GGDEF)-like protein